MMFKVGDRVRHEKRPEWGLGHVQRVEPAQAADALSQRLIVRFSNAGLKTLSTLGAPLQLVTEQPARSSADGGENTLLSRESSGEAGWLGAISKAKPEDAMMELPEEAVDPFRPLEFRVSAAFELFRFRPDGGGLIDWAVARSGLADPLSRFTRHELEEFFHRWSQLRERNLAKVLGECRVRPNLITQALASAPASAHHAVKRINASR